jgi:hypothetical protein
MNLDTLGLEPKKDSGWRRILLKIIIAVLEILTKEKVISGKRTV